ncbi:hypothetical protein VB780_06755 [Leptolyngbya sp. CCNP1308]|uniref:hypothetical protein n=1 Tax=Leptolyngbya sp. CCNP1308 TaxID=3110255 RepID=UPI002B20FCA4|nr:hypothetical protein [Leptolyngbya sp. CCNP1308]MEA5448259.1 hypothetical protein [Leptolyngbya sp. CCNP1308]
MLPLIVVEELISTFKFWNQGIHDGMLHRSDFYIGLQQFPLAERSQAYSQATLESSKGLKVCITVSKTHYTIWVELRSQLT